MSFVVDASVAVKWFVPENYEQEAEKILSSGQALHAPELILPEFSNIIWKKVRLGEITGQEGKKVIDSFLKINLQIHPHKRIIKSAFAGATLTNQTVYDWTYLALAVALSCQFVTAGQRFFGVLEKTKLKQYLLWIGNA